jgi:glutathione S-transferase
MTELEPALIRWMHARREGTDETEPSEDYYARRPVLQQAIAEREWLLGEQFSIADIICAKVLSIARDYQLDVRDDAVSAYIRRALERPRTSVLTRSAASPPHPSAEHQGGGHSGTPAPASPRGA